eukprot:188145-Rhodomonas_salina.4
MTGRMTSSSTSWNGMPSSRSDCVSSPEFWTQKRMALPRPSAASVSVVIMRPISCIRGLCAPTPAPSAAAACGDQGLRMQLRG